MKPIQVHNDKAYLIYRRYPKVKFETSPNMYNMELVKMFRDWLGADHVLQDAQYFMFCETIQDIEFEEIDEEDN